ncbi:MAG: S46 family peptidase [Gemmatimonadetes bacterium]|nr:S46 family peptidase [Gemmatimonadota bacterium]
MNPRLLQSTALWILLIVAPACGPKPRQAPAPVPAAATPARAPIPQPPAQAPAVAAAPTVPDSIQPGRFDTGKMWTFENPPLAYFQEAYGFTPSEPWLKRVRLSALRLPNCSASFVSPNGLVMSNHHCAREAATAVAKPGENLIDNGFYAAKPEDERKAPDIWVDQLVEIRDVTQEVASAGEGQVEDAQAEARQNKINEIEERVSSETGLKCDATSLYHGGKYSLYCYRRYDDIRLVFVPEVQVAYFGGDPDNFTYPRYDLDVSFFRVYDKNGQPLKSENFLPWSPAGAREGDAVFVIGNPGSTSRLETVAQLEYKRDVQYPFNLRLLGSRAEILAKYMKQHPEKKSEIENDYFSLTNSQKAITGELQGLRTPALMARKVAFERNFKKAVAAKPDLQAKYGTLWNEIADLRTQIRKVAPALNALNQGGLLRSKTLEIALGMIQVAGAAGRAPDSVINAKKGELLQEKVDRELDAQVLGAQLEDAVQLLGASDSWVSRALAGRSPQDAARAIADGSALPDSAKRAALLADPQAIGASNDPAIQLMRSALPRLQQTFGQYQQLTAQEQNRTGRLARALFDVYGTAIAPDATFTLRLADGVVQGYDYNGTRAPWFTTFYGMYDRYFSNPGSQDWALPKRWQAPPAGFDLKTPLDIVTTNDIIGGNSGSPMVDQQGRIVGLIFDGNIESLPGDFIYTTESNRAVAVHSQAIVSALRDVYSAKRIVDELTATIAR